MFRLSSIFCLFAAATVTFTAEARLGFTRRELQGGLELCQGDCDADNDCMEGLKCFHRVGGDPLPLCGITEGEVEARTDFCVPIGAPDNLLGPSVHFVGNNGQGPYPLGKCQGDCDDDSECQNGLTCYQRNAGEPVPGCRGGSFDGSRSDYCIDPADQAAIENTNFPVSSTREVSMFLNYTISQSQTNRQPTDEEYSALVTETDKWLTDQTDGQFASSNRQLHDVALTLTTKDYVPNQTPSHQLQYDVKMTWGVASDQDAVFTTDIITAFQSSYDFTAYTNEYLANLPQGNIFRDTVSVGRGMTPPGF